MREIVKGTACSVVHGSAAVNGNTRGARLSGEDYQALEDPLVLVYSDPALFSSCWKTPDEQQFKQVNDELTERNGRSPRVPVPCE